MEFSWSLNDNQTRSPFLPSPEIIRPNESIESEASQTLPTTNDRRQRGRTDNGTAHLTEDDKLAIIRIALCQTASMDGVDRGIGERSARVAASSQASGTSARTRLGDEENFPVSDRPVVNEGESDRVIREERDLRVSRQQGAAVLVFFSATPRCFHGFCAAPSQIHS